MNSRQLQVPLNRLSQEIVASHTRDIWIALKTSDISIDTNSSSSTPVSHISAESFSVVDHQVMEGLGDLISSFGGDHTPDDNIAFKQLFVDKWVEQQATFVARQESFKDPDKYIFMKKVAIIHLSNLPLQPCSNYSSSDWHSSERVNQTPNVQELVVRLERLNIPFVEPKPNPKLRSKRARRDSGVQGSRVTRSRRAKIRVQQAKKGHQSRS